MTKAFRAVAVGLVFLSLTGCATFYKTLFVSGVSLAELGKQFIAVSEQVTAGCVAKSIPVPVCERYRVFGVQFKKVYPLTVGLWEAARAAGDVKAKNKAEAVMEQLATDLSKLTIEALQSLSQEVKQ